MNKEPIIEMLAFFSRFQKLEQPAWRKKYVYHIQDIRSCNSNENGGVKKSYYTLKTKSGEIIDLSFDEEEFLWTLDDKPPFEDHVIDRVLALFKRHKFTYSTAHKIIPIRFELIPKEVALKNYKGTEFPLIERVQPFRYRSGKIPSTQVIEVLKTHLENLMITNRLNYLVRVDSKRLFHIYLTIDELAWRIGKEKDEEFLIYDNRKKKG